MAGNLGTGWLTTRKAKKRKPLKEKNEGLACTETEEKVCSASAHAGQSQPETKPVAQPAENFYCCPECEKDKWYASESTQEKRVRRKKRKRARPCTPPELWDMWNLSFPESDGD